METEEKKAFLLLKSIIFQYHGLDENELQLLEKTARELNATEELKWALDFISEDYLTAFDRARTYLNSLQLGREKWVEYLVQVWKANNEKGHITEMEAIAMLRFARDLQVENELISNVRGQAKA